MYSQVILIWNVAITLRYKVLIWTYYRTFVNATCNMMFRSITTQDWKQCFQMITLLPKCRTFSCRLKCSQDIWQHVPCGDIESFYNFTHLNQLRYTMYVIHAAHVLLISHCELWTRSLQTDLSRVIQREECDHMLICYSNSMLTGK